jgi:hypothetical protein
LQLVCAVHGLPVAFALATPTTDERQALVDVFDVEPGLLATHPGQTILVDKGYRCHASSADSQAAARTAAAW